MSSEDTSAPTFDTLGLASPLLKAISAVGYETPSPIQQACIPLLLEGRDMVGQAQTGTGKTGAFALPLLSRIPAKSKGVQILVLAPTRELAIQVAEACQQYSQFMKNVNVMPIYGGQSYSTQLRQLSRGVEVVVGTPGRVMDHMRRGTLKLDNLQALVLDEADEMLRMGFIDDVEWVLEHVPDACQIALFSATMPKEIRKVATSYLKDPKEIKIESKTSTASTVRQRYVQLSNAQKMDAMTRILETEEYDGVITFVRTKTATTELTDKLNARGYAAEALNGDVPQQRREQIVKHLKSGKLDILVATDVAARGLDVDRISHVINYDIPYDTEAYVHRIGRTGRAGRSGDAILFITRREHRLLRAIENATKQQIEKMAVPGAKEVNETRVARFKQRISDTISAGDLDFFTQMISDYQQEHEVDATIIAAALAQQLQGQGSLLIQEREDRYDSLADDDRGSRRDRNPRERQSRDRGDRGRGDRNERGDRGRGDRSRKQNAGDTKAKGLRDHPDVTMARYRVDVGYEHGVKPGNIVGAIANEANLESQFIGHIEIYDDYTTVDLPSDLSADAKGDLQRARVCQQKLNLRLLGEAGAASDAGAEPAKKPRRAKPANGDKPRDNAAPKKARRTAPKKFSSRSDDAKPSKRRS